MLHLSFFRHSMDTRHQIQFAANYFPSLVFLYSNLFLSCRFPPTVLRVLPFSLLPQSQFAHCPTATGKTYYLPFFIFLSHTNPSSMLQVISLLHHCLEILSSTETTHISKAHSQICHSCRQLTLPWSLI